MKNKNLRFISWIGFSIGLGSLPFIVNLIILYIIIGDISYTSAFQVNDLMYFCITLNATTMYDLFLFPKHQRSPSPWPFLMISWFLLFLLTLIIAVVLGVSYNNRAVEPVRDIFNQIELRLVEVSLYLVVFTLIVTVAIQIYIKNKIWMNSKRRRNEIKK